LKKIDILVVRAFIGPFVVTFFIALFALIMQFLWKYIDDLVGKGLEISVIAELIFFMSASVVPLALPIATLLSSIMTFGNLGERYELVALKSAGISFVRFMRSLVVVSVLLSGLAFAFANYVLPVANLKFAALLYSVTKQRPALNIKPGVYYDGIEGYVIRVGEKDAEGRTVYDIQIYDHTENRGNVNVLLAEKGEMYTTGKDDALVFKLYNGVRYEEPKSRQSSKTAQHEFMRTHFKQYEMVFDLSTFDFAKTDESLFQNNHRMLNIEQLRYAADSLITRKKRRATQFKGNLNPYFSFIKAPAKKDSLTTKKGVKAEKLIVKTQENLKETINKLGKQSIGEQSTTIVQANDTSNKKLNKTVDDKKTSIKAIDSAAQLHKKTSIDERKEKDWGPAISPPKTGEVFWDWLAVGKSYQNNVVKRATNLARNVKSYTRVHKRQSESDTKRITRYNIAIHEKITLSLACLVLFLIGAALGAIIRKGGLGMPMIMAIVFFVIFHIITTMCKKFAEEAVVSPFVGMWLATFILFPFSLYLIYHANNDVSLFDTSKVTHKIKQIRQAFTFKNTNKNV